LEEKSSESEEQNEIELNDQSEIETDDQIEKNISNANPSPFKVLKVGSILQ